MEKEETLGSLFVKYEMTIEKEGDISLEELKTLSELVKTEEEKEFIENCIMTILGGSNFDM